MSDVATQVHYRLLEELAAAEERYRDLVESLRDVVFRCDRKGNLTFLNATWEEALGRPINESLGRSLLDFIDEEDRPLATTLLAPPTGSERRDWRKELCFRHRDGSQLWLEVSVRVRRDGALVGLMHNITERRRMENALRVASVELERRVAERTAELEREILARRDAEEELRRRLETIESQRETIQRLSTPVIQIWDGLLVLPLIGVVDRERAAQIMEDVLRAVVSTRSKQVFVDLTGVPVVDMEVAEHLLRLTNATQIIGAECVLVGISPAVARALVQLEVNMHGAKTFGTLQDGLRAAFQGRRSAR